MRPTYSFSEAVVEAIARERYRHPDPRVQERMEILWLKSQNEPHGRIAKLASVSRSTVQRTLRIYATKGLDGIRSFGWKGQPSALTPHRETIEEDFMLRQFRRKLDYHGVVVAEECAEDLDDRGAGT